MFQIFVVEKDLCYTCTFNSAVRKVICLRAFFNWRFIIAYNVIKRSRNTKVIATVYHGLIRSRQTTTYQMYIRVHSAMEK